MARPLRIEMAGGVYYVTTRGGERRDVVRNEQDRGHWLRLFDRVAERYNWRVYAWALMRNHWHLFLTTPEPNLSRGMHDLNSGYAALYNRRYRRYGALFQGRFKAILVQEEGYGWSLSRYVHLNPVRAGATERPEQYRWTSYRDYLNPKDSPSWLDWATVLGEIGGNLPQSRAEYARYVRSGIGRKLQSPLAGVVGGVLLGTASWVERMRNRLQARPARRNVPARRRLALRPTVEEIQQAVCEAFGAQPRDLLAVRRHGNDARAAAVYLAREHAALPVGQLAERFGAVHASAISRVVRRAAERRVRDRSWDRLLSDLERNLKAQKSKLKT